MINTTICPSSILARVKLILSNPVGCWTTISAENKTAKEILISYTLPLLVASVVAGAIGMQVFGIQMGPLGTVHPSIGNTISTLVSQILMGVLSSFLLAWVVQKVATFFNGSATFDKAYSWIAYGTTPVLVAGLLGILPALGGLASLLGVIYSLYILFKGIPAMVSVAAEKHLIFFISVIVGAIIAGIVSSLLMGALLLTTVGGLNPSM